MDTTLHEGSCEEVAILRLGSSSRAKKNTRSGGQLYGTLDREAVRDVTQNEFVSRVPRPFRVFCERAGFLGPPRMARRQHLGQWRLAGFALLRICAIWELF